MPIVRKLTAVLAVGNQTPGATCSTRVEMVLATPIQATTASIVAYCCGIPVSFLGQSRFTFRVGQTRAAHLLRFALVTVLGLSISYLSIVLASSLSLHPIAGVVCGTILVPIMSFIVMNSWVFRT